MSGSSTLYEEWNGSNENKEENRKELRENGAEEVTQFQGYLFSRLERCCAQAMQCRAPPPKKRKSQFHSAITAQHDIFQLEVGAKRGRFLSVSDHED